MKWKREDDALVSGPFLIEVVGETSTGRPVLWSLKKDGEWVFEKPSRRTPRAKPQPRQFKRLRDAKRFALRLANPPPKSHA